MLRSMHLHTEIYPNLKLKYIWIIQNVHEKYRFFILAWRDNRVSCNQTLGCINALLI